MKKTICELFAGVGGFRLGFERDEKNWETVWFNQWEPGAQKQWAHQCYVTHFGDSKDLKGNYTTNIDIAKVKKSKIPDHSLLVGGFPCQDYSVAHGLASEKGIHGKKGVLWWQIYDVLKVKAPPFCLFENVDRLLKSPSTQRGRDFGVMLACFNSLNYTVEWRVINAAEYGAAQRRRRVFIFAYKNNTNYAKNHKKEPMENLVKKDGFFASVFAIEKTESDRIGYLDESIMNVSDNFKFDFQNAGIMKKGEIFSTKVYAKKQQPIPLKEIVEVNHVAEKLFITDEKLEKWRYNKGAKKIQRVSKNGFRYVFSEGAISFPDSLDLPGRTMLTSESTLNRSSHIIEDVKTKKLRILTPIEAERLQGFDDNWTNTGMPDRMRYFCMGNALVVPMITKMSKYLDEIFKNEN